MFVIREIRSRVYNMYYNNSISPLERESLNVQPARVPAELTPEHYILYYYIIIIIIIIQFNIFQYNNVECRDRGVFQRGWFVVVCPDSSPLGQMIHDLFPRKSKSS